jgi:hypothetical protein
MCIVSSDKVLNITIHNQYSGLELISPVYFSDGTTYRVSPSQQTDASNTMVTSFGIDPRRKDFKCVSLYELQRKYVTETDNQSDNSTISIENTATYMYLLVAWVVKDYVHKFCACLIEFTDDFTWDEDKLWTLYEEYNDQFYMDYEPRVITWSMNDDVVVKMKLDVKYGSDYELDIVIFEGAWEGDMKESIKINPKRLVLSLPMFLY